MKNRILHFLSYVCFAAGLLLSVLAVLFFVTIFRKLGDEAAVALSAILSFFMGLAALMYLRAFTSFRKVPSKDNAVDVLVGVSFAFWVALTSIPKIPGEIILFGYGFPKSIIYIIASYALYRVGKRVLLRDFDTARG